MKKTLNVAIIGYKFMGKAHSNAWLQAARFFDLPAKPVLKIACGRNRDQVQEFADNWGWQEVETDWRKVIERDDIDIVDISLPPNLHAEVAIAAAKAGKHIFCEKPMAIALEDAKEVLKTAEAAGVRHYLNHNYRKMPAVALAKRFIEEGKLGTIYHWRGCYLQDWIVDPQFPLTWHLRKEVAGSGPHGDLNSHSVDLAQYLVGGISSVSCLQKTFIKERPIADEKASATFSGKSDSTKTGEVTVEDCSLMMVEFKNGAVGSFEATRFATGRKNYNRFEIYGSEGSLTFCMERPNELEYCNRNDAEGEQGFRKILATDPSHPYVNHWWPAGHNIGYEHGHIHAVADFIEGIEKDLPISPDFNDGVSCMEVLEAGKQSATSGQRVYL
ncbi:MAG: Gfo/Idh/MocA family oxidoreductase [Lentisphaeraceae bacterium]|nr:Gfo/Idh/MocA family oxidoreductase [Lentisphaeraceae bacterium]